MNTHKLKRGYYYCACCGANALHNWHSGISNQEFETYPANALIPDDVFGCNRCLSGLIEEEWERANNTDISYVTNNYYIYFLTFHSFVKKDVTNV